MDQALHNVRELLMRSSSPAVLSSFGKDSMLLLWLVRQVRPETPVVWLRTGFDERFARRVIRNWDLTVFRWHPADIYLLTDGEQRTLVHEYGVGEQRLPLLIDLDGPGPCATEVFPERTATLFLPFDTLLVGWKDSDTHWVKGDAPLAQNGFELGAAKVFAPLRHMSDAAVRSAIIDHDIPYEPVPDELSLCTHCVSTVPVKEFRSRFNLAEEVQAHGGSVRR